MARPGPLTLVDGKKGSAYSDGSFQGFEFNDMDVVIDLGQAKEIEKVSVTALQDIRAWIFFPERVEFSVSPDGEKFNSVGVIGTVNEFDRKDGSFIKEYAVTLEKQTARFVRVRAKNMGWCPSWHSGYEYKGKAWVFADEIVIR